MRQSQARLSRWIPALLALALAAVASCGGSGYGGGGGNPYTPPTTMHLELNSGDLGPGQQYQHQFTTAGTFNYHCLHHPVMTGSVTVSASASDMSVTVSITSSTSPFPGASVKPGGTVVWINNTDMVHTVTSD